jgi:hypothetical protein
MRLYTGRQRSVLEESEVQGGALGGRRNGHEDVHRETALSNIRNTVAEMSLEIDLVR